MILGEKRILEWVEKHIYYLYIIAITIVSIAIRYGFRDFVSGDMVSFLLPWYEVIDANGGINSLQEQVGDYNLLYQTIIAFFTYLPLDAIYKYKILSGIFDYLLAAAAGYFIYDISKENKVRNGLLAYTIVCLSPLVFLNSACWGQCDSIYTFFCVASLVLFMKERYGWAFLAYGIAFCFKFQTIFLLPFYLFAYLIKKSFSILNFLWIPGAMVIVGIPALIMGRGIKDTFLIYLSQTETYTAMFLNYPSFWRLILVNNQEEIAQMMKMPAILFTVAALGGLMFVWLRQKAEMEAKTMVYMAFIVVFTCVLFLPAMHERYGFLYEILSIVLVFLYPKTLGLSLALHILSMRTYGYFLFDTTIGNYYLMSVVNVIVYVIYVIHFYSIISGTKAVEFCGQGAAKVRKGEKNEQKTSTVVNL